MSVENYEQSIVEMADKLHHHILESMNGFYKKNKKLTDNKDGVSVMLTALNQVINYILYVADINKKFHNDITEASLQIMVITFNLADKIAIQRRKKK